MNKENDLIYLSSLNSKFGKTQTMIIQLQQENKQLKEDLEEVSNNHSELVRRSLKVIEYIENFKVPECDKGTIRECIFNNFKGDLLEILKGDSNE